MPGMARTASPSRRWGVGLAVVGVIVPALALGVVAVVETTGAPRPRECVSAVDVYTVEQIRNARTIVAAGVDAGLPVRDQTIAVMTAMGESSLRNIDYGDWETSGVTNPDGSRTTSIGLFQQQDGWGSREQRLDPYTAATLFYRAMITRVPEPERSALEPTTVAHRTQVNADPRHYARYWTDAERLVDELAGAVADAPCR